MHILMLLSNGHVSMIKEVVFTAASLVVNMRSLNLLVKAGWKITVLDYITRKEISSGHVG